jgi:hypothetical protein
VKKLTLACMRLFVGGLRWKTVFQPFMRYLVSALQRTYWGSLLRGEYDERMCCVDKISTSISWFLTRLVHKFFDF